MDIEALTARYALPFQALPGEAPAYVADVDAAGWVRVAHRVRGDGGRLVALWGTDRGAESGCCVVSAAYVDASGLLWLRLAIQGSGKYPALSSIFPAAERMQRTVFDLLGIAADGADDVRPWLNHGRWPRDYFPLRQEWSGQEQFVCIEEAYPFVPVAGDGVHEIAVGPIHAGVIEPGHFRFSVVGEKVLRLEQHLGYTHKGTDKLFAGRALAEGHRLAGRISGDATVAYAWAYCMAAESAAGCVVPLRAQWLRALLLERERVANHLGDLGALGNDAGLALGLAQFMRLKEDWIRLNGRLFAHRFMMDRIIPGGVAIDLDAGGTALLAAQCDVIEDEVRRLRSIYDEHTGLQDRFIAAGRVAPKLAAELGLCGLAGRASGLASDARADQRIGPYAQLDVRMATHRNGDVAARVTVRFDELFESLRLLRDILRQLPPGPVAHPLPPEPAGDLGIGWIESWRGPVFVALELVINASARATIRRCHCQDPSWFNWPGLQHAIMGNIVPDFPLINKSFNLSYSGHDR